MAENDRKREPRRVRVVTASEAKELEAETGSRAWYRDKHGKRVYLDVSDRRLTAKPKG